MAGNELSVHRGVNIFHSTSQLADHWCTQHWSDIGDRRIFRRTGQTRLFRDHWSSLSVIWECGNTSYIILIDYARLEWPFLLRRSILGERLPHHIFGFNISSFSASLYILMLLLITQIKKKSFCSFSKSQPVSPKRRVHQPFRSSHSQDLSHPPRQDQPLPFQVARVRQPPRGTCTGAQGWVSPRATQPVFGATAPSICSTNLFSFHF